jgi:hypothetical protein
MTLANMEANRAAEIDRAVEEPPRAAPPAWRKSVIAGACAFVVALLFVRFVQIHSGADGAAFGSYPDEPAHFLSGLMIRDYVAAGLKGSPLAWAVHYYLHAPFFAVGYWPPFFYVVEALWMMVFGIGWIQSLWLTATIGALIAATIFHQARHAIGIWGGACAGLIFLLWPPVEWSNCALMTDTTVALLSLWASIALGRYLDTERAGAALLFGVCAALTILTKYSGLFLAVIPLPALVLARRWALVKRGSFWLMPAVVMVLWAPWLALTARYAGHGLITGDTGSTIGRLAGYLNILAFRTGPPIGLVLMAGWAVALLTWRRLKGREIVWLIQAPVILGFLVAAPIPLESRYLVPVLAPLILLSCSVLPRAGRFAVPVLVVTTAIYAQAALFHFPPPAKDELRPVAEFVLHQRGLRNASILAPADKEGPMIAQIASIDPARGSRILARPNKLFANIDWNSSHYEAFYRTPGDMEAFFETNPIDLMILHYPLRPGAWPHERDLQALVNQYPDRWRLVGEFPAASGSYRIYQFSQPAVWNRLSPLFVRRMTNSGNIPRNSLSEAP